MKIFESFDMEEEDAGAASSADRSLTLAFGSLVGSSLLWNGSCFEQVNTEIYARWASLNQEKSFQWPSQFHKGRQLQK